MLRLAWDFLVPGGHLFLAVSKTIFSLRSNVECIHMQLPLPCVMNSRYLTCERLTAMMEALGFFQIKERYKAGGKMLYSLYRKGEQGNSEPFSKKTILRQGDRNNFSVLL